MKQLILDFKDFENRREVHEYIARMLDFPDYYGHNLDALFDVLSVYPEELSVYLFFAGKSFEEGFLAVFTDLSRENPRIRLFETRLP